MSRGIRFYFDRIQFYLNSINYYNDVIFISGRDKSGKTGEYDLHHTERFLLDPETIPLADKGNLRHFYIPASYDCKTYVVKFMAHHFMYSNNIDYRTAVVKADDYVEEFLSPFKIFASDDKIAIAYKKGFDDGKAEAKAHFDTLCSSRGKEIPPS